MQYEESFQVMKYYPLQAFILITPEDCPLSYYATVGKLALEYHRTMVFKIAGTGIIDGKELEELVFFDAYTLLDLSGEPIRD